MEQRGKGRVVGVLKRELTTGLGQFKWKFEKYGSVVSFGVNNQNLRILLEGR